MKCIIGLGNPGKKYETTRHNIGFMIIDKLLKRNQVDLNKRKFTCQYTVYLTNQEKVMLVKPQTFMNLSGEGVRPLLDYYQIKPEDVLVVYDDLDLPLGNIRLREKGGHGGHNGIKSLMTHLGTKDFKRLRIGIGRPVSNLPIVQYVLQSFTKDEKEVIESVMIRAAEACEMWTQSSFHEVMNVYNKS